jgi:outer membrane immunogenic protein
VRTIATIGALISFGVLAPAFAADLPVAYPQPAIAFYPTPPVYSWNAFYIGGNAGWGWSNVSVTDGLGNSWSAGPRGFVGGGQVGGNAQFGHLVLGLEADIDYTDVHHTGASIFPTFSPAPAGPPVQATGTTDWMLTLAGRVGVAFDRVLVYGKGGGALVQNNASLNSTPGVLLWSGSNTTPAWVAGGGIEIALAENWSARLEYNYVGLRSWTANPSVLLPVNDMLTIKPSLQTVTLGVSYLFR